MWIRDFLGLIGFWLIYVGSGGGRVYGEAWHGFVGWVYRLTFMWMCLDWSWMRSSSSACTGFQCLVQVGRQESEGRVLVHSGVVAVMGSPRMERLRLVRAWSSRR